MTLRPVLGVVAACSGCVTTLSPLSPGEPLSARHPAEASTRDDAGISRPSPDSGVVYPAFLEQLGTRSSSSMDVHLRKYD